MEAFTSDLPDGWTADTGTAGVDFLEETTTFWRGTSSLEIASGSSVTLEQDIAKASFSRLRRYALYAYANTAATAGTITIQLLDGVTVIGSATQSNGFGGAGWNLMSTSFNIPAEIEADNLTAQIVATGGDAIVYLDDIVLVPMTYWDGVAFALTAGSDKWLIGDKFEFDITNDEAGKIQTFFRKVFGFQLPSDASPTITDPS